MGLKGEDWKAYYAVPENRERIRADARARYWADPLAARDKHLRRTYGISAVEYDTMAAKQGGRCAICGREPYGRSKYLYVDHSHDSKKIRGLLCLNCNAGIGALQDDPALMERAATYIRETE